MADPAMAEDRDVRIESIKDKISKLTAAFGAKKKSEPTSSPAKGSDIADKDAKMKRLNQRGPDYSESVDEGAYQDLGDHGREIYTKVQGLRDKIRSGKVSVNDELADKFSDLLVGAGLDPEFAEKEWNRITGQKDEPVVDPKYRKQAPEMDPSTGSNDAEDDDAEFLNKLRGQARSGSIKVGADTGEVDEDDVNPEGDPLIEKGSSEDIFKSVIGFLDTAKGTWTKGRDGIIANCTREFGEKGGKDAEKLIILLSKKYPMKRDHNDTEGYDPERMKDGDMDRGGAGAGDINKDAPMEDIIRLAGLTALSEKKMSRIGKGIAKFGKDGIAKLAELGREGASEEEMDDARDKYNKYKK